MEDRKINTIVDEAEQKISVSDDRKALNDLRVTLLGKSGKLTELMKSMRDIPAADRPAFGKMVNDARVRIEKFLGEKLEALHKKELEIRLNAEKIDISIDKETETGNLHPLSQIRRKVEDFFISMGFIEIDGPEIETDYYNFEALNTPADHPARDMQDTFYITDRILLRSQTSAGQIRTMENNKPPIKMITVGRVYRSDDIDATHSPVFHQIEGLVVDEHITMCDLKGMLDEFAKYFFGSNTKTRFRPSYFPFTEPSVEVDASCPYCHGKGCRVCKGTGWIEILGAGMVNRNVLKNCDVDPDKYTGFAFGIGLDRITTIIYGINDMRLEFENDVRFLKQFN